MKTDAMVKAAVAALEDIKGRDISVIDVHKMTALFDKLIIVSGDSTRQNKALADNLSEQLKSRGVKVVGVEGTDSGEWILVDLGAVVVHIMQPVVRQYYNLEELWSSATPPLKRAAPAKAKAKAKAAPARR